MATLCAAWFTGNRQYNSKGGSSMKLRAFNVIPGLVLEPQWGFQYDGPVGVELVVVEGVLRDTGEEQVTFIGRGVSSHDAGTRVRAVLDFNETVQVKGVCIHPDDIADEDFGTAHADSIVQVGRMVIAGR